MADGNIRTAVEQGALQGSRHGRASARGGKGDRRAALGPNCWEGLRLLQPGRHPRITEPRPAPISAQTPRHDGHDGDDDAEGGNSSSEPSGLGGAGWGRLPSVAMGSGRRPAEASGGHHPRPFARPHRKHIPEIFFAPDGSARPAPPRRAPNRHTQPHRHMDAIGRTLAGRQAGRRSDTAQREGSAKSSKFSQFFATVIMIMVQKISTCPNDLGENFPRQYKSEITTFHFFFKKGTHRTMFLGSEYAA